VTTLLGAGQVLSLGDDGALCSFQSFQPLALTW
jgi:hypothetical protein